MHNIDRTQLGFGSEMESFEYEFNEAEMGENETMELAGELLEISSEQEFENFLGDLISKAGSAVRNFAGSPTGQALGGILKDAARQALPVAGQAIGGYFGGATGAKLGGQVGKAAGSFFEAEGESESEYEDREWEAANSFVKLATDAAKKAATAPAGSNPMAVARQAVIEAAQSHAPQLVKALSAAGGARTANGNGAAGGASGARSGRWIRHHNRIILIGA